MAFTGSLSGSLASYHSDGGWRVIPPKACTSMAGRDRFIAPRAAHTAATAAMKESLFPNEAPLVSDVMNPPHFQIRSKKKPPLAYEEALCLALFDLTISQAAKKRILPTAKETPLPVVPAFHYLPPPPPLRRHIPLFPTTTLDAPNMTGDFYRSPLSWSSENLIAVQLDQVYIKLMSTPQTPVTALPLGPNQPASCSVHWLKEGSKLIAANPDGTLELYDAAHSKIGTYSGLHVKGHKYPTWNAFENLDASTILAGNDSGALLTLDTRVHTTTLCQFKKARITRIAYSTGHTIAMGANNNSVTLLDLRKPKSLVVYPHQAAVKALAWDPWDPSRLITGAGIDDRSIRLFDVARNLLLDQVETGSQVCTLFASRHFREFVSTHGFSNNEIKLWRCRKTPNSEGRYLEAYETILHAHKDRVLHAQMSPDGTTLATSSSDETLKFWPMFVAERVKNLSKALTIEHTTIR